MPVDFFNAACQEPPVNAAEFGIVDPDDALPAFTTQDNRGEWIATIRNDRRFSIVFTAIDHCIELRRPDGSMDNRCDGMLIYPDNIVFVELKIQRDRWVSDAINQLESTIEHFKANHDLGAFRHKRAFACNKKRPYFQVIDNETNKEFFRKHRVRLNVQAEIVIK